MRKQTEEKLEQYAENFDDIFPLMQYSFTEQEIVNIINKCIINNKPAKRLQLLSLWEKRKNYSLFGVAFLLYFFLCNSINLLHPFSQQG